MLRELSFQRGVSMDKTKLLGAAGFAVIILPFAYGITTLAPEPFTPPVIKDDTPPLPDPVYLVLPIGIVSSLPGTDKSAEVGFTLMVERSAPQRGEIEAMVDSIDERLDAVLSESIRLAVEEGAGGNELLRSIADVAKERLNGVIGTEEFYEPVYEVLVTSFKSK